MTIKSLFAALLFGVFSASAVADSGLNLYEKGRATYRSSRNISPPQKRRLAFQRAASDLKKFIDQYRQHPKRPDALFNLGLINQDLSTLFTDRDSATRALHYFRGLVAEYPKSRLADDSLYSVSQICEKTFSDLRCRDEALNRILGEYSTGDIAMQLQTSNQVAVVVSSEDRAELSGVEVRQGPDSFEILLKLSDSRTFTSKSLPGDAEEKLPARFYVDLPNTHLDRNLKSRNFEPTDPISQIRFGQNTIDTTRVVVDLASGTTSDQVQLVEESGGLRIRVGKELQTALSDVTATMPAPEVSVAVAEIPKREVPAGVETRRRLRIIVDAGHGGEDPGAIGRKGTREKDIALAVAKRVDKMLRQIPDYEVFMTRSDDTFISLQDRTKMANAWNGDLFVSVHCNASPRRSAEGVSTYFLDNADDEESLRVAMRENAELVPVAPSAEPSQKEDYYLNVMKASMIKNFHTVQSTELARHVQATLLANLRQKNRDVSDLGVKSARFYVLTGATMPAVLVETSFITNAKEEKRLKDEKYQDTLARAVVKGVNQFFHSSVGQGDHTALYRP